MAAYVSSRPCIQLSHTDRREAYDYIERVCAKHTYARLGRAAKGTIRAFLVLVTGYSDAQVDRLIGRYVRTGHVVMAVRTQPTFRGTYTYEDIVELARIDELYEDMSGPAVCAVLKREHVIFSNEACVRLQYLSSAQLYRFRSSGQYRQLRISYTKTRPTKIPIGERRKPEPNGAPGFIRVDTVHQGDKDGEKGVYHINLVDEVTQWEIVVCVEGISERYMLPALEAALALFPFTPKNFHADNGSEYINQKIAALLQGMLVKLTKSRPRHSGDNGLVETKNGAVIRKALGYAHIPRTSGNVACINRWYQAWFIPYLNFHRPCAFRQTTVNDKTGKVTHAYPKKDYQTPYDKLQSLTHAALHLRPGLTFELLNLQAYAMSDSQWAAAMQEHKAAMWSEIKL